MMKYCVAFLFTALVATATLADDKKPDAWQPARFLVGRWKGTVTGESGTGTVERSYEFILLAAAMWLEAALTGGSGLIVAIRMREAIRPMSPA